MNSLVSVIIPTYNRAHYIREAVESVLAQSYKNFEIIVVDDGSTDGTEEVLHPYRDSIRYFYQENQGASAARNLGIKNARGKYIAFLDSDDFWLPEMLEVQVGYLEAHPEAGMVHADFLILDEGSNNPGPRKRTHSRPKPSGYIFPELFIENAVMNVCVIVRRASLEVTGLFDPEFRRAEDYHLWLRIARHFPIAYINRPLGICRRHAGNTNRNMANHHLQALAAMEKMLHLNPEIANEIGSGTVRRGLFNRAFAVAYYLFDEGAYRNGRLYFAKALRLWPCHWPSYGYYLASWLPPAWVKGLRRLKRSFAKEPKPFAQNAKNKE